MVHLLRGKPEQGERDARAPGLARGARVLEVGAEEGGDVRARLGDDEVVHVEQLGHA